MIRVVFERVPELIDLLPVSARPTEYDRGDYIYTAGPSGLYFVQSGIVRVMEDRGAEEPRHLDFHRENGVFGERGLFPPYAPHERAVAYSNQQYGGTCRIIHIQPEALRERMNDKILLSLLGLYAERRERILSRMMSSAELDTGGRVVEALIEAGRRLGRFTENGEIVIFPSPTHDVVASMASTRRELATSNLNELRRQGFIEYTRSTMWLKPALLSKPSAYQGISYQHNASEPTLAPASAETQVA